MKHISKLKGNGVIGIVPLMQMTYIRYLVSYVKNVTTNQLMCLLSVLSNNLVHIKLLSTRHLQRK